MPPPRSEDPGAFPRQQARTRRFTLGLPRTFTVSRDGARVLFLRSGSGEDPVTALWVLDVEPGRERLLFDPGAVAPADVPAEERALRERAREAAEGVVAYSTDREVRVAAFAVGGSVFVADIAGGEARRLAVAEPAVDPRVDPTGRRVAYVRDGRLRVIDVAGEDDRELVGEDTTGVSWGLAEFVAAEEMERRRGFWWSPDGERLAVARVDERDVQLWHAFDPAEPSATPRPLRYPAAGTANADVSLWVVGLDGSRVEVAWDRRAFEYLARVVWNEHGSLTLVVQRRDQRVVEVLAVGEGGGTTVVRTDRDDAWVDLVEGVPGWLAGGHLVSTAELDDTRRLVVGDEPVTPPGLQVHRLLAVADDVLFAGSDDPMESHVWRWSPDEGLRRLTETPGIHDAAAAGGTTVITTATVEDEPGTVVHRRGADPTTLASRAERPVVEARPRFFTAGQHELRVALLLPGGEEPDRPLPVLLDPYGGPHHQRVVRSRDRFLESQWFGDRGFAVLVADGRGTPGRGPAWDRAIHRRLLEVPLEDQVAALEDASERFDFLDRSRVAIRGWSFGGELAAAAVLRRPDVFHAAIAGAPVTDSALYDTHYTERYLGRPDEEAEAYRRSSLIEDAAGLSRPLLVIHGLSDDNVFAAHSLRLSRALLAAGRPHSFLPLPGITHMATEEAVAENLLLLQLRFLRESLGLE